MTITVFDKEDRIPYRWAIYHNLEVVKMDCNVVTLKNDWVEIKCELEVVPVEMEVGLVIDELEVVVSNQK